MDILNKRNVGGNVFEVGGLLAIFSNRYKVMSYISRILNAEGSSKFI